MPYGLSQPGAPPQNYFSYHSNINAPLRAQASKCPRSRRVIPQAADQSTCFETLCTKRRKINVKAQKGSYKDNGVLCDEKDTEKKKKKILVKRNYASGIQYFNINIFGRENDLSCLHL